MTDTGDNLGFPDGGAVDPDRHIYVSRPADTRAYDDLVNGDDVHIFAPRMSGKTSLAKRTLARLRDAGYDAVHLSFQEVIQDIRSESLPSLAVTLCRLIADDLGVPSGDTARWRSDVVGLSAGQVLATLLPRMCSEKQLVVFLDEVDLITSTPRGAEFLSAVRTFQERRTDTPELARVRLCLIGVRPVGDLFYEGSIPTAIAGRSLWLDDFPINPETISTLARGFQVDQDGIGRDIARRALEYSGGFPRVCTWLCKQFDESGLRYTADIQDNFRDLIKSGTTVPEFLSRSRDYLESYARLEPGGGAPNPRRAAIEALWVYQDLLERRGATFDRDREDHQVLRWSGLAVVDRHRRVPPTPATEQELLLRGPFVRDVFPDEKARKLRVELEQAPSRVTRAPRRVATRRSRLCILTTGGVIGMVERNREVVPPASYDELRKEYADVDLVADVEWVPAVDPPLDSANIGPGHWKRIASSIHDRRHDFDGFVVAHGTDTLAYSASAVAFALGPSLSFPVVFTGAQTTVAVRHGDARANLIRACMVALQPIPEVVVCFGEQVLRAVRAQKKDDRRFDAFESPAWPPLASVTEEVELYETNIRTPSPALPRQGVHNEFSDRLLLVTQAPGVRAALYEQSLEAPAAERPHAIILQTLGAGHVPAQGEYSHESMIRRAVALDIPVLLTSQYQLLPQNILRYTPARTAAKLGAMPMGNLTLPALVAKISWVLGQISSDQMNGERTRRVRELMAEEYIGEGQSQLAEWPVGKELT